MRISHSRFILLSSIAALTALAGCSYEPFPTNWMSNGYKYQDNTPLSSPAPTRPWVKQAAKPDLDHMADNTAAWQGAVYELINPMPQNVPVGSVPLVLFTRAPSYPADNALDHYLRQGLLSYGYTLAKPDQAGISVVYDAAPLSNPNILALAQQKFGKEFMPQGQKDGVYYLTLQVIGANGRLISDQATLAVLPYEKTEYQRWPGFSTQPVQGWSVDRKPVYDRRD